MSELAKPRLSNAELLAQQRAASRRGPHPSIACDCGRIVMLRYAYKCLYCSLWFCQPCAEHHFGKTRAQHQAEVTTAPHPGSDERAKATTRDE